MPLTKEVTYAGEWLEDGQIQVKQITRAFEDGVFLGKTYHRHVVDVGDDVSQEPQIVQDIAQGLHTQARIAARNIVKAAQELDTPTPPVIPNG